jgi:hypothetical protein
LPHTPFIAPTGESDWPSVTQIVGVIAKPQLMAWYAKVGTEEVKRVLNSTGDLGSEVHAEIYSRFNGTVPDIPITVVATKMADSFFEKFVKPFKVEPIELEKKVINTEHRYHGTFDGIVKVTGLFTGLGYYNGPILADWKTSSGIYDTMGIQLGGYWKASTTPPPHGLIVRIDKKVNKKGTYSIQNKAFKDLQHYSELFLNARALWDYVNHKGAWSK